MKHKYIKPWNGHCQRCGKKTDMHTMSWFNTQLICMDCDAKEHKRSDIKKAKDAELKEVKKGNLNFKGIGL